MGTARAVACLAVLVVLTVAASAAYEITPSVVASGGGTSSGGSYSVSGTVGQPSIGVTSGPSNIAEIGFWYQPGWILTGIDEELYPTRFLFDQNYPNPFNPVTTLRFGMPRESRVVVKLYSVDGREVRTLLDEKKGPGYHELVLNGASLPSGVYFCRMEADSFSDMKKLILLK
jgi:hypothetical protein